MDVHATLRHLRMAPRKVRLVIDTVRGLPVNEAETRLQFVHRDAALPVLKLLRSAIANAEHNFHLDRTTLIVKTITADGGPVLKRSRPRAMGRGVIIRKRTSHIHIVLSDGRDIAAATDVKTDGAAEKKTIVKKAAAVKKTTKKEATKRVSAKKVDSSAKA